jgi:hypothetical protein
MPEYRVYLVGDDGHFVGCEEIICLDDAEALEKAKRLARTFPFELWSGLRWIDQTVVFRIPAVTHETDQSKDEAVRHGNTH